MLGQYLITFRETFEAALLLGVVLAYLARTGRADRARSVWTGAALAVLASACLGAAVYALVGELPGAWLTLFEGAAALLAAAVLTWMILWMALGSARIGEEIRGRVDGRLRGGLGMGLVGLAFILVFREGLETVLFLAPNSVEQPGETFAGASLGVLVAVALAYMIFRLNKRIDLKRFFYLSSILLVLLAAGLVGYGTHELLEYGEEAGLDTGPAGATAFDAGVPADSVWHKNGVVGSVFAVLFGYATKMEWGRVITHLAYLAVFLPVTVMAYRNPQWLVNVWARLRTPTPRSRTFPPRSGPRPRTP
jgi:high-affinity iron transporter